MNFVDDKDGDRRRKSSTRDPDTPAAEHPRAKAKRGDSPEIGSALRSVYQRTVNEDIPPAMLDLLGKLG